MSLRCKLGMHKYPFLRWDKYPKTKQRYCRGCSFSKYRMRRWL